MNSNVHVKRILWPATKALAMRKKNNPDELAVKKALKRTLAEDQHAQQLLEDTPSEEEEDEDDEGEGDGEDNEVEVMALCSEKQGVDLTVPVSDMEWEDKKSDILFTTGSVSEECYTCDNPHVLYTIGHGRIHRKVRLDELFKN